MEDQAQMLWTRIKCLAKENKLTQEKLAAECNINYRTLQNWITRSIVPDAISITSIAKVLGVSVEYLVTGTNPPSQIKLSDALNQVKDLIETLLKDNGCF